MSDSIFSTPEDHSISANKFGRKNIAYNLQKSLQLLDEATGTSSSFLRISKTPKISKPNSFTSKNVSNLNQSSLLNPSFLMTPTGNTSSICKLDDLDNFTTKFEILIDKDPGTKVLMSLYTSFMEALKRLPSEHQLFDLLTEYQKLCSERAQVLKQMLKKLVATEAKFHRLAETLISLINEQQTWYLIKSLYQDRLYKDNSLDEHAMIIDSLIKPSSDKQITEALYNRDAATRQNQLVVDWLENNAADEFRDKYYDHVEFFTDKSIAWENTLNTLKEIVYRNPDGSNLHIVTEMDPDAPIRQNKPLEYLDMEDEKRFLKHIFAYVRSGQLDAAQKLCIRSGQPWRAATLEGWKLHHDPNYETTGSGSTIKPIEGNLYRDIWINVCWEMAQDKRFNIYERAIYAALSGDLANILPACHSWEDHLWAYFKVMVNRRVEQELQMNRFHSRPRENLPQEFWGKTLNPELIFQELQASSSETVQKESKTNFHIIQKYIILEDVDGLIEEMYEWSRDREHTGKHLIRFMAHLVLFFRVIGCNTKEELCVAILEAYVKNLIDDKLIPLIATYCATLPQDLQVICYAKFLEGIHNNEERQTCLMYAEAAGLDVPLITKNVVENIRKRDVGSIKPEESQTIDLVITEEDRQKIEAIDWLVFDQSMRAEAIRQANALMRIFLASKKLTACKEIFQKIPSDSIDIIIKQWQMQTGSTDIPPDYCNATREYLCIKAYLDAHDNFNDWFQHFHHAKPEKPHFQEGSSFIERVEYEHKEKQYLLDLDHWNNSLQQQTVETACRIKNVLLFVDGGWMVDQKMEEEVDESRQRQMELLRQQCLPPMCFLLHTVLHSTGQYKECLQIADTIASEEYMLFKLFSKDELQKFLSRMRDSSITLLDQKLDPFGYPLS